VGKIRLVNMEFYAYHGVAPEEKSVGQIFQVDVEVDVDLEPAAASDALSESVNYVDLFKMAEEEMSGDKYDLIETVAGKIADRVLEKNLVNMVTVRIRKPHAPIPGEFQHIEVELTRMKN